MFFDNLKNIIEIYTLVLTRSEVPSNEVTTTVVEPPKDEVVEIVNPETSDNINIIYLTALVDMLLLGFFVRRKREN